MKKREVTLQMETNFKVETKRCRMQNGYSNIFDDWVFVVENK